MHHITADGKKKFASGIKLNWIDRILDDVKAKHHFFEQIVDIESKSFNILTRSKSKFNQTTWFIYHYINYKFCNGILP